jgi:SRSO17 transposase
VPEEVAFATKPKLGLTMLKRALDAGVPCAWVAGDSVYDTDSAIRRELKRRRIGCVLTVTSGQRLWPGTVSDWIEEVPADGWKRLSAGDGAKGPRLYDWAHLPFRGAPQGWNKALLIRRRLGDGALTFYLTHAPEGTALADLVRVAGARWTIESSFEMAQWRGRARPVRGALLDRMAPPHHLGHAGIRLPHRLAQGGHRGERTWSTRRPT